MPEIENANFCHPERSRWIAKRAICEVEGPLTRLRDLRLHKEFLSPPFICWPLVTGH
jgi:hypothetical protein